MGSVKRILVSVTSSSKTTGFFSLGGDLKDRVRRFDLPSPTVVRCFIVSQCDPEAVPGGVENLFYVGYLCLNGDVVELAYYSLFI